MAASTSSKLYWTCASELDIAKPTVIFLHAAWMSSSMFEETIKTVSPSLRNVNLLSVDVNGHGKTVAGRKSFTLWDQATDVVGLMDELKVTKAIFVGISMGALIALHIALAHPSRSEGLVLLAATATAASPDAIAGITYVRDIWVSSPHPSEEIMNMAIGGWGGNPNVDSVYAKGIKEHWVERHSGDAAVDPILDSVNGREDLIGRLAEVSGKVLIVHGECDETWKLEEGRMVRDALCNADVEFEVVNGAGHLVIGMGGSEELAMRIGEFVKSVLEGP